MEERDQTEHNFATQAVCMNIFYIYLFLFCIYLYFYFQYLSMFKI